VRRHAGLYFLLALIGIVTVVVQVRVSADAVTTLTQATDRARWPFTREASTQRIVGVQPEAAAAGVRQGDVLVSVEGEASTGRSQLARRIWSARKGDLLEVTVRAPGGGSVDRVHSIVLEAGATRRPPIGDWARDLSVSVLFPALCLVLGFWVTAVRPFDPLAWLLLALMLGFANFTPTIPYHWEGIFRDIGIAWLRLTRGLWPISMLLFGLYFPDRFVLDRKAPWFKWILIAPLLLLTMAGAVEHIGRAGNESVVYPLTSALSTLFGLEMAVTMSAIGMFFFSLGWKTGTATSADARRRLLMLHIGTTVSMLPLFSMVILGLVRGVPILESMPRWYGIFSILMLLLFPLTLAYVIVVHRALDVRVAIRQGVQYAVARGGVFALRVATVVAIIVVMSFLLARPNARRVEIVTILGAGVSLLFFMGLAADRLGRWTDRRFFRNAYQADHVLTELAEKVGAIVETRPLLEIVARTLSETLHVRRICIFTADGGAYRPAWDTGAEQEGLEFAPDSATVQMLRRAGRRLRVYREDPRSWIHKADGPGPAERAILERLDTQLLLPMMVRDRMAGFISMGPKLSEAAYSGTDLRVLESVATQTGFALEHSRLTEAVAAEAAHRERLTREVEIAREVQHRLFPQRIPEVAGLDCYGTCRPALGVGGDYYDFLQLGDGALGVAIADVSGKGIGAALMMAGLQASLRGQAARLSGDPGPVLDHINRLVHESTPMNRYATFFFCRFDRASGTLTYVNAGHCRPFIIRAGQDSDPVRLTEGGTVIGLFPVTQYRAASVPIEPGDPLVCFTDGISEAMNHGEEEWGEDRLMAAARACARNAPREVADHLMTVVDKFVAGAPQHDDMTLVVVRVVPD